MWMHSAASIKLPSATCPLPRIILLKRKQALAETLRHASASMDLSQKLLRGERVTHSLVHDLHHTPGCYRLPTVGYKALNKRSARYSIRDRRWLQVLAAVAQAPAADVQDLVLWLRRKGLNADKLAAELNYQGDSAVLVARRQVSRGDTLFGVPEAAWLTPKVVKASAIGPLVEGLDAWLQIALFLLFERQQGSSSAWQGYLSTLPAFVDTPLSWSEAELQPLRGTQLMTNLEGYREFFKGLYSRLESSLFSQHRQQFGPDAFSFPKFLWAVQTMRSRVHAPLDGRNIALVPFADLVQHRRGAAPAWKLQSGVFGGAQAISLEASTQLQAGEPITMDFGPGKLDSTLLLDYGVLDLAHPQAGFLLPLELPEQDRYFDDKADILETNGLAEAWQFTLRADSRPSAELLAFLRLINLTGPDAFLLEALFRNEAWSHLNAPMSEENEGAVCRSMIDGCREALQGYVSSIDEDLALLREDDLPPRIAKAVQVRLGEKEALEATLEYFEQRIKRLGDIEYYQERRLISLGLLDEQGKSTYDDFFKDGIA